MHKRYEDSLNFNSWNVVKLGTLTAKMDIKILNAVKHEGAQIDTVKALMVKSDDINQPWTIRSKNLPVNVE